VCRNKRKDLSGMALRKKLHRPAHKVAHEGRAAIDGMSKPRFTLECFKDGAPEEKAKAVGRPTTGGSWDFCRLQWKGVNASLDTLSLRFVQ